MALRSQAATGNIPIILLTARGLPEDRVRGLELGADDYITKPFDINELVARVRSVGQAIEHPQVEARGLLLTQPHSALGTVQTLAEEHEAQLLNYLKATPHEVGLLINFGPQPQFKRFAFENTRKEWWIQQQNQRLSEILNHKNVRHWFDIRPGAVHDWPVWREMMPDYLGKINYLV